MARKKININANPLESVTIGRTDTKKNGWIGILFLFIFFILIIYFLPDIQKAYKDYLYNKAFTNNYVNNNSTNNNAVNGTNTITNVTNNTENENTINKIMNLNEENEIVSNNITFSNIKFDAGSLTFLASNKTEENIDLTSKNMFIKLYSENDTLINTLKINGIINKNSNKSYVFNIINSDISKFSLGYIEEKDYDLIMLNVDENNKSAMNCHNDVEKILYFFDNDKLYKIEDTITISNNDSDYNDKFNEYNSLSKTYQNVTGLNASFIDNDSSFRYRLTIDYNIYMQNFENIYYYKVSSSPIKISFEMKAMGFTCS